MTKQKVLEMVKKATTKSSAQKAIKAYEQYKDETHSAGPENFTWAEMNAIDKCFELSIQG